MLDVYVFLRYQVKDAVYHAGHIVVDDAQAAHAHALELRGRQIDGVCDIAVFEVLVQLLCGHLRAAVLALGRAGSQMRQSDDVLASEYLLVGEVGDVLCDLAGLERREHRIVVNDLGAGLVDYPHAVAHGSKGLCIKHVMGVLIIGDVYADIVAAAEYLGDIVGSGNVARQPPRGIDGHERVVTDDVHVQRKAGVCDQCAGSAEAEHADGLAHELGTGKVALALFDERGYPVSLAGDALYPLDAADNVARGHDHGADGLLLDCLRICTGAVEHNDAELGIFIDGNVIIAGSRARNGKKLGVYLVCVHIRAADDYAVGRCDIGRDIASLIAELVKADGRNVVYRFYVIHYVLPRIFSYIRRERAHLPLAWRCTAMHACRQ